MQIGGGFGAENHRAERLWAVRRKNYLEFCELTMSAPAGAVNTNNEDLSCRLRTISLNLKVVALPSASVNTSHSMFEVFGSTPSSILSPPPLGASATCSNPSMGEFA